MRISRNEIQKSLAGKGLKVTPQRISVLEAIYELGNHPTADQIIEYIKPVNPGIAKGTVYKVLDTLVVNGLVKRVKTDRDIMRYDGIKEGHHHLYCSECDLIEDFEDPELDSILKDYFRKREIPGFTINDIILQINGHYLNHKPIK